MNWFLVRRFFHYQLKARHYRGYGIHSPFVFDLVRHLIHCKPSWQQPEVIKKVRQYYLRSNQMIAVTDLGAGSSKLKSYTRKVKHIAKYSAVSPRFGILLSKLVSRFNPETILEFGTSLGISALYLAHGNSNAKIITMEGCHECADLSRQTFSRVGFNSIEVKEGAFDVLLPGVFAQNPRIDFAYIDGNHTKEATLRYAKSCIEAGHSETVIVLDDIHWSKEMEEAWSELCNHPQVTVSMDLFRMGILFLRRECQKQHFVVRY
jgi:predicted O-methyltransferase YrrM